MKTITVVLVVGFLAWLSQLFTPVHPKEPDHVFGRTLTIPPIVLTWDGHIAVKHWRSEPVVL